MNYVALGALIAFVLSGSPSFGQQPTSEVPACGRAKVHFPNPEYLQTQEGIVVIEAPNGWFLDRTRSGPFYLLRNGDKFETARTVMYINVEPLEVSFQTAIQRDVKGFGTGCEKADVQTLRPAKLLEQGCEAKTQIFSCRKKKGSYVDLVTKIAFNGSLLNVVLSADTAEDIERYHGDYDFLLQHLTMIKSGRN